MMERAMVLGLVGVAGQRLDGRRCRVVASVARTDDALGQHGADALGEPAGGLWPAAP